MHDLKMLIWTTDPVLLVAASSVVVMIFTASLTLRLAKLASRNDPIFPYFSRSAQRDREEAFLQRFKGEADNGRGCASPASGDAARFYVAESHGDASPLCPICADERYHPASGLCAWCDDLGPADPRLMFDNVQRIAA